MKEMDKILRNKLGNLDISVPDDVWAGIERSLDSNQRAGKRLMFYRYAAAIAALAIVGSSFLYIFNKKDTTVKLVETTVQNTPAGNTVKENIIIKENKQDIKKENIIAQTQKPQIEAINKENIIVNPIAAIESTELQADEKKQDLLKFEKLNSLIISLHTSKNNLAIVHVVENRVIPDLYYISDESLLLAVNTANKAKQERSKWMIGGEFSPLYSYRHITETQNGKDAAYYNELENPVLTYSGGVHVQYSALKRLTVQTGVYYSSMGQSIDYLGVYANNIYDMIPADYQDRYINSYSIENSAGNIEFNSKHVFIDNKSARVNNLSSNKGYLDINNPVYSDLSATIEQNLKYLEIPLILRYKIIDKIIDVNLIGGLGANFLIENNVYLKYSGVKEDIGHTQGVNKVNYSGNIGFGIDYPLTKQLNFRLEPSFRYYLNPVSSSDVVESHPYTMGLFTGICYSF